MKQISVQMFILVCIFSIPGLMIFHLKKAWNKFERRYNVQNHSDIGLNTMVNDKRSLELDREVTKEEISSVVGEIADSKQIPLAEEEEVANDTDRCSKHSSELDSENKDIDKT